MRKLVPILLTGLTATAVTAQESSVNTTNKLPEVVVTASRLPDETVPLDKFPGNVTVITRKDIENTPAFTLPDLLHSQVGFMPLDTVGFGSADAPFSLRGYGDKPGTLILVDGVRVNDAGDGFFLWNSIPLNNIERVEIIRGGSSTMYGEGAVGGVINIITKKPGDQPFVFNASGAGGNLGYYSGHIDASGSTNRFSYVASVDRQGWDGWRDFSDFRSWTASVKPSVDTPIGRFTLSYLYHWESSQNPAPLTQAQYNADPHQSDPTLQTAGNARLHRLGLNYSKSIGDNWTLLGNVSGQIYETTSSSAFGISTINQPNITGTLQASYKSEIFGRQNTLTFGTEETHQDFGSVFSSAFGDFTSKANNWTVGGFAQDNFEITKKLTFTAGLRYDYRHWDVISLSPFPPDIAQTKNADAWSPKAALDYEWTEKINSWVSVSRAFRLPTGFDIGTAGVAPGTLFFANPSIAPVDARTVEVGTRVDKWKLLSGSLTYYYSKVKNDIVFDPITFQNLNFDSVKQGVELTLASRPCDFIEFFYNTAYTDSHFDGGAYNGNRLPLVPTWLLSGGVRLYPAQGLTWTLEAVHVDGQTVENDLNNQFRRNDYTVLNTKLSYRWRMLTTFAAVNNLTNTRYQQFPTTDGFQVKVNPSPGVNFQVGLSAQF